MSDQGLGRTLVVRVLVAVLVALVPVVALSLSPWGAGTGLLVLGLLPTLSAVPSGPRAMLAAAIASVIIAFVAVLVANTGALAPWLGAALVAVLALGTGTLAVHGLHPIGGAAIAFTAYVLVDPSSAIDAIGVVLPPLGSAALVTGGVLFGCAWVIGAVSLILRGIRLPAPPVKATLPYGVLLAVLCGLFTLVCALWMTGTNAWWAVMTVAVVLQPTHGETRTKLRGRILGTVLGCTIAAVAVLLLPSTLIGVLLGVAATLASVVLLLSGAPYWQYSLTVTVSVMLLTFGPNDVLLGDVQRITATLVAAGVTAAAVSLVTYLPARLLEPPRQEPTS